MSDDIDKEYFRERLLNEQQLLEGLKQMGDDAAQIVELDQSRVGRLSRMDALQGQAMSQETQRRRQLGLQKIAAALRRIESDEYGYCLKCDEEIAIRRLEIDPAAPLCITCAEKMEHRR